MSDTRRGQVATSAADVYEEFFVPALFGQFATAVCDAADVSDGDHVVDVACGTGAVARAARDRVGTDGSVIGVDVNQGMLATARRAVPGVEWRQGRAEDLPLDDGSVDAALCQFGLMFFDDRPAALTEMIRVVRPGGRVVVATWADVDRSPGYAEMTELLRDELGPEAARSLEQPFVLGDADVVGDLMSSAGLTGVSLEDAPGVARFSSLRDWVHTDIRGWTLADAITDAEFDHLLEVAQRRLARFVEPSGAVEFPAPALIASVAV